MKKEFKPRQIMLSKRANIFYLDKVRIMQKDMRLVYLSQTNEEMGHYFNIPERNTSLLLLGKGSSITDAAARKLADSNVLVGFCGNGGTPLFSTTDPVFLPLTPHSEYGPNEYMQQWCKKWFNEPERMKMAVMLVEKRMEIAEHFWSKNKDLKILDVTFPENLSKRFLSRSASAITSNDILMAEAEWAKSLYALFARSFSMSFTRDTNPSSDGSISSNVNNYITHGNYLAYGLASVVLNGLGVSYCFPLLHGKTRRGALVFDVADLIKDAIVLPCAFICANNRKLKEREFRAILIDMLEDSGALDVLFAAVKDIAES